MSYSTGNAENTKSVKITTVSSTYLVDSSTGSDPNYWTYTDTNGDATTFHNYTGTAIAVGDRIIIPRDQANVLMKEATYNNTYFDSEGSIGDVVALTISTGGTASDTLAAMTVTTPADLAAVAAQLVIIQNSIKSLGTKVNEILAAN